MPKGGRWSTRRRRISRRATNIAGALTKPHECLTIFDLAGRVGLIRVSGPVLIALFDANLHVLLAVLVLVDVIMVPSPSGNLGFRKLLIF